MTDKQEMSDNRCQYCGAKQYSTDKLGQPIYDCDVFNDAGCKDKQIRSLQAQVADLEDRLDLEKRISEGKSEMLAYVNKRLDAWRLS